MARKLDLTGKNVGRLTVLEFAYIQGKKRIWKCQCDCGNYAFIETCAINAGRQVSCGCYGREIASEVCIKRNTSHGKSNSRIYKIWFDMVRRCNDERRPAYKLYGAKGVKICDRWLKFENFLEDMGDPPSEKYSIDRIDYKGNYEPQNCRWATDFEQANNRSNNHVLFIGSEKFTIAEAARKFDINYSTLRARLARGTSDIESIYEY